MHIEKSSLVLVVVLFDAKAVNKKEAVSVSCKGLETF